MRPTVPSSPPAVPAPDRSGSAARPPWWRSAWRFARPHTIFGTTASVWGLWALAAGDGAAIAGTDWPTLGRSLLPAALLAWIACLNGNLYIVGLNQLEDIEIDRINKPHLPLASGAFSRPVGQAIVAIAGLAALALAGWGGPWLLATVATSLAIGTAYSLPPVRLKRFPFLASLCILTVRGAIVNLGLYAHFRQPGWAAAPAAGPLLSPAVLVLTAFIAVFAIAIAIFKDIPDSEGDRRYNIATFVLTLGTRATFDLCRWILTACYGGAIAAAIWGLPGVDGAVLGGTHGAVLAVLWIRSGTVDLTDRPAIARFYQFVWLLFFLEYALFPAAVLAG